MATSKKEASLAGKTLGSKKSSKLDKSLAGSDLANRKGTAAKRR